MPLGQRPKGAERIDNMPIASPTGTWSLLLLTALAIVGVWITARIVSRAGFRPWWAVLILLPVVNLAMIYVFAFVRWPILQHPAIKAEAPPHG